MGWFIINMGIGIDHLVNCAIFLGRLDLLLADGDGEEEVLSSILVFGKIRFHVHLDNDGDATMPV
jgi:hypothetical protein